MDFRTIKSLTGFLADQISAGTLDAPCWDVILTAKVAARIYAPLGTRMTLGDHVRVVRAFVESFKKTGKSWTQGHDRTGSWDQTVAFPSDQDHQRDRVTGADAQTRKEEEMKHDEAVDLLAKDLMVSGAAYVEPIS